MKLKTGMAVIAAATTTWAAVPDLTAVIRADQPGHTIPGTLHGIFFEDINYAADGGIAVKQGAAYNLSFHARPHRGYIYSGMADVAALKDDEQHLTAIHAIWESVVGKKDASHRWRRRARCRRGLWRHG